MCMYGWMDVCMRSINEEMLAMVDTVVMAVYVSM